MARSLRIFKKGNTYHIVSKFNLELSLEVNKLQGIEQLIYRARKKFKVKILSYSILKNHFHLLVHFPKYLKITISKLMQWLGTTVSQYVNKMLGRSGKVFKDRFKSFEIKTKKYVYRVNALKFSD